MEDSGRVPLTQACSDSSISNKSLLMAIRHLLAADSAGLIDSSLADLGPNQIKDVGMGLGFDSVLNSIFKAVHHFSSQDRSDAIAERKRNQTLLDFISSHGHSLQEVNDFSSKGGSPRKVNADNVFVNSPLRREIEISAMVPPVPSCPLESPDKCPNEGLEEGEISVLTTSIPPAIAMCELGIGETSKGLNVVAQSLPDNIIKPGSVLGAPPASLAPADAQVKPKLGGLNSWKNIVSSEIAQPKRNLTYHPLPC